MHIRRSYFLLLLLTALLWALPASAEQAYHGRVTKVFDGDTVDIVFRDMPGASSSPARVRLVGIDTMESHDNAKLRRDETQLGVDRHVLMYWGQVAGKRAAELLSGKDVSVTLPARDKQDKYGRLLARIHLNGTDINLQLVREGLAIVYRRTSMPDLRNYYQAEREARADRNGFWSHPLFRDVHTRLQSFTPASFRD